MTTQEPQYYTVREAADLLRVSRATVWRWIDAGKLRAYRVGRRAIRIKPSDLDTVVRGARDKRDVRAEFERYIQLGEPPADGEAFIAELEREHARQLAARGGKPFESSVPLIHEAREEWSAQH